MSQKNNIKIKKVLVVGLGLIGASLCRDVQKNSNYKKLYGHYSDNVAMEYALKNYNLHDTRKVLEEVIKDSDLIVLCFSVHAIRKVLNVVKYFFNGDKVITVGELHNYILKNVHETTKNLYSSLPQTPQLFTENPDRVLLRLP